MLHQQQCRCSLLASAFVFVHVGLDQVSHFVRVHLTALTVTHLEGEVEGGGGQTKIEKDKNILINT